MFINNIFKYKFVILIFLLGFFVRVYKLDSIPPALNWDEVANGYNAYSIAHWAKDEWGKNFPLVFTSFRDDKHPVAIYFTAPVVGIFGLNNLTARFPATVFSSIVIILIFFLAKLVFKSESAGYFSALFLATSPYHIFYSRGLWEVNFAFFFFLLGLTTFFYGFSKPKLLYISFLSFGLSLYSYHSSKIVVPPVVFILIVLYFSNFKKNLKHFILSLLIFIIFLVGLLVEPRLLGLARAAQNRISEEKLQQTWVFKKTQNETLASVEIALLRYPDYFSYDYLFLRGDQNARGSIKMMGEFYKINLIFLVMGLIGAIFYRSRIWLLVVALIALSPFPAAISSNTPNATRGIFMLLTPLIISGYGASFLVDKVKTKRLKYILSIFIVLVIIPEFFGFLKYYFRDYSKKDAIEWQYGMKEIVEYVDTHPEYKRVYMDNIRQQPYIFFLFYTKQNVNDFLNSVKYDESQDKSFNTVASYNRFIFSDWDWVNSYPTNGYLYILEPYKYSGLKFRNDFDVVKLVKYPDGGDAFYLVTGYW